MIRVLIVDDSAVVRQVLSAELSKAADIQVVATATDPFVARDKIVSLRPDVVTLDIEMPRMDGLTFLGKLMKYHPLPVVVVSSVTPEGGDAAIRALELGALDVVSKPGSAYTVADVSRVIVDRIRAAASARRIRRPVRPASARAAADDGGAARVLRTSHMVLAVGASTGGTEAIRELLMSLPATTPGTLIVQHMPEIFTAAFARRLNDLCRMEVREAANNDILVPGLALVAPGNRHMVLRRSGARYFVEITGGPRVHHQRPSVDVLFYSVARHAGPNAVGVLLTGMGTDGAKALLAMRQEGATTLVQDEASSVVFGMPREAIRIGAAQEVVSLSGMPGRVIDAITGKKEAAATG